MAKANKIREFYNTEKKISQGKSNIICDNGQCSISSNEEIMGIEINFRGLAEISPKLPKNWYLRGNKRKMLIFTTQNIGIKDIVLFEYKGYIKIDSVLVGNSEGKQILCNINKNSPNWINNYFDFSLEGGTWDTFKDNIQKGLVNQTSYIIDDDLATEEPSEKIETKVKTTRRTTATYSSGSSRGSGGY